MDYAFFLPVVYHNESENHTSEVGEVRHSVVGVADANEELNYSIAYHHPFGFDGYRNEHKIQRLVGKQHAECEQNAVDRSRSTYGDETVEEWEVVAGCKSCIYGVAHVDEVDMLCVGKIFYKNVFPSECPYELLDESCAYAAGNVVEQISFATEDAFERYAEHEQGEHIE